MAIKNTIKHYFNFINLSFGIANNLALFVLLFSLSVCYSQKNSQTQNVCLALEKDIRSIENLLVNEDEKSIFEAYKKIKIIESRVANCDDIKVKLFFYRIKAGVFIEIGDYETALANYDKGMLLLNKYEDKRSLGLFYEVKAILEIKDSEKAFQYFIKEEELLREYGTEVDKIDANFNLVFLYMIRKNWEKAYYHANKTKEYILKTNVKRKRLPHLDLFIFESLLNFGRVNEAFAVLNSMKKNAEFDLNDNYLQRSYYMARALYFEHINDYKTAMINHEKANYYYNKELNVSQSKLKRFLKLENELELKIIENKKIASENKLNRERINYQKYGIILTVIVLLILISLVQLLKKSSQFKAEINLLFKKNNKELMKLNDKMEKAIYDKKYFLDTIFHELRTPINTMKGVSYLANNEDISDDTNYYNAIEVSSENLLKLVDNILDFNSLEKHNKPQLNREIGSIRTLILNCIDFLSSNRNNANTFQLEFDSKISETLVFDKFRFSQIVMNLLDNANKFTSNGSISIIAKIVTQSSEKETIFFSIQDTGIGIEEKNKEKIFDLFYQGSEEINRKYGGCGIGLTIVKKSLELYNSTLNIESIPNKETKVSFEIEFDKKL